MTDFVGCPKTDDEREAARESGRREEGRRETDTAHGFSRISLRAFLDCFHFATGPFRPLKLGPVLLLEHPTIDTPLTLNPVIAIVRSCLFF